MLALEDTLEMMLFKHILQMKKPVFIENIVLIGTGAYEMNGKSSLSSKTLEGKRYNGSVYGCLGQSGAGKALQRRRPLANF